MNNLKSNKVSKETFECMYQLAFLEFSNAQYILGCYYKNGLYVKQDIEEAIFWFEKAAQQKNSNALFELAIYYSCSNIVKSIKLFIQASENGNVESQYILGNIYFFGHGVVRINYKEASEWYEKAVNNGHKEAAKQLQICKKYLKI